MVLHPAGWKEASPEEEPHQSGEVDVEEEENKGRGLGFLSR